MYNYILFTVFATVCPMPVTKPAPQRFPLGRHDAGDGAERLDAATVIDRLLDACEGHVAIACSFQRESAVLIELMAQAGVAPRLFTLDTHLLFPETYEAWRAVEARYGIEVEVFQGPSLRRQAALYGDRLWERDPDTCCRIRKVGPLVEALEGLEAWMSGLRREQSPSRATTAKLAWDERHGLWKACPIADWTAADVAGFIDQYDLSYNSLHDRGYDSIGCVPCTRPGTGREGRWAGHGMTECGLHSR